MSKYNFQYKHAFTYNYLIYYDYKGERKRAVFEMNIGKEADFIVWTGEFDIDMEELDDFMIELNKYFVSNGKTIKIVDTTR